MRTSWRRENSENGSNIWRKIDLGECCVNGSIIQPDTDALNEDQSAWQINTPERKASQVVDLTNHRRTGTVYFHQIYKKALKDNSHDYPYTNYLIYRLSGPPARSLSSS